MQDHQQAKRGGRPSFVAGQGYSARYLASKHGISPQQARDLIAEVGHDRERLNLCAMAVRIAGER